MINDIPAGDFSSWLRHTRSALNSEIGAEVACGECIACCCSSYFIHIKPNETQTISRIDKRLLFAAPGLPKGNVLLGYDEKGRCPMLIDKKCAIYEHRPQTCRSYDCRIFAAAGTSAGNDDKALIKNRIRQWKFSYPTMRDRDEHSAVQAAAKFILERAECFPGGAVPSNPSQLAILAIKVYDVFLGQIDQFTKTGRKSSDIELAKAIIEANEKF